MKKKIQKFFFVFRHVARPHFFAMPASESAAAELRLPPFFPAMPAQCKAESEALFAAFTAASKGELKGILGVDSNLLVSSDFKGDKRSSIVDAPLTKVVGQSVKVLSWYDNEWGYSNRVVDLIGFLEKKGL